MIDTSLYSSHIPVMLEQCMALMDPKPGGFYADGTLGAGGHSEAILKAIIPDGRLLAFDLDPTAIKIAGERLRPYAENVRIIHDSYVNLGSYAEENSLDGFIVDLGVSSMQLDQSERGFSFLQDGPLDMRFSQDRGLSAADIVNDWPEEDLAEILWKYGEERKSRQIAAMICAERKNTRIETTGQLKAIITDAVGPGKEKIHPATRSFQAIRIAVNDELKPLEQALKDLTDCLKPGGRICVITFHSLEDRIVKRCFKTLENPCICPPKAPICTCGRKPVVKVLAGGAVAPSAEETERNPRARSAKLRVAEKRKTEA